MIFCQDVGWVLAFFIHQHAIKTSSWGLIASQGVHASISKETYGHVIFQCGPCLPLLIRPCWSYVLLMFLTVCSNAFFVSDITDESHSTYAWSLSYYSKFWCTLLYLNNVAFLFLMAVTKPIALLTWLLMTFNTHTYKTLCFICLIYHGSHCSPSELL